MGVENKTKNAYISAYICLDLRYFSFNSLALSNFCPSLCRNMVALKWKLAMRRLNHPVSH